MKWSEVNRDSPHRLQHLHASQSCWLGFSSLAAALLSWLTLFALILHFSSQVSGYFGRKILKPALLKSSDNSWAQWTWRCQKFPAELKKVKVELWAGVTLCRTAQQLKDPATTHMHTHRHTHKANACGKSESHKLADFSLCWVWFFYSKGVFLSTANSV